MTDLIKKLSAEYEKAFNALEVEKQVPFFEEHFISAGPRGSIAQGRDEFSKMASKAAEFYRSVGAGLSKNSFNGRNPNQQQIFHGQSPLGSDVQEDRKQAD